MRPEADKYILTTPSVAPPRRDRAPLATQARPRRRVSKGRNGARVYAPEWKVDIPDRFGLIRHPADEGEFLIYHFRAQGQRDQQNDRSFHTQVPIDGTTFISIADGVGNKALSGRVAGAFCANAAIYYARWLQSLRENDPTLFEAPHPREVLRSIHELAMKAVLRQENYLTEYGENNKQGSSTSMSFLLKKDGSGSIVQNGDGHSLLLQGTNIHIPANALLLPHNNAFYESFKTDNAATMRVPTDKTDEFKSAILNPGRNTIIDPGTAMERRAVGICNIIGRYPSPHGLRFSRNWKVWPQFNFKQNPDDAVVVGTDGLSIFEHETGLRSALGEQRWTRHPAKFASVLKELSMQSSDNKVAYIVYYLPKNDKGLDVQSSWLNANLGP